MNDAVDRLLHDVQQKIGGAVFALTLAASVEGSKANAVKMLQEADAMIDEFALAGAAEGTK